MKKNSVFLFAILIMFLLCACSAMAANNTGDNYSIAAGVVPHHLLAKEIMEDFFTFIAGQEQHPDTIILLSPDHFNCASLLRENSFITLNWNPDNVKLRNITVDADLLKKLAIRNKLRQDDSAIALEFGITNLLPLISYYLPDAKIVPLLIPADISPEEVSQLVETINQVSTARTLMIGSVDFSHYLPLEAATFHDSKSIRVLLNFEEEHFENIEVDSWQSLYAVRLFARLREHENPAIIARKNSVDFLPFYQEETTSYFSVIFRAGKPEKDVKGETILLTGDAMLGRGIEELMRQYTVYYPFQKIVQLLRGNDIVFTNLEGPVVETPPEFTSDELKFAFHPKVLEGVRWSRINLLSLANNHMMDMGKKGLEETIDWLNQYHIEFIGNPLPISQRRQNSNFATRHSVILAFNRILPFIHSQEDMIRRIKTVKQSNPEKFMIVSIHWGNEYQPGSIPSQQDLAGQMISAGADLIIGHHPHVVQEIELVQGKPVFYSLGNFIFDRQVLPETREGLIVGLNVEADHITCRLFPIKQHSGQPVWMNQKETRKFLRNLAMKSDQRLWQSIEEGIIEIERIK